MSHKQVNIRMPEALRENLQKRARAEGISFTELVNQLAINYLDTDSSKISTLRTDIDYKNISEEQNLQVVSDTASPEKSAFLDKELASNVEVGLIAKRLALWESHVLSLQNQLLKFKAELEQRFSSLEAQLTEHSPQLNTFLTRQSGSYPVARCQALNLSITDSNQQMQSIACPNQTWIDTPASALPTFHHKNDHMSTQPSNTSSVERVSTLGAVPRQWLSLAEAYAIAQQGGYRLSMCAFRLIATHSMRSIQRYGAYGLGIDASRRGTAGIVGKWFYRLERSHS